MYVCITGVNKYIVPKKRYIKILKPEILYNRNEDREYAVIPMQWLYPQHAEPFCKECAKMEGYGDIFRCAKGGAGNNDCVMFYVPVENIETFEKNITPQIQDAFANVAKKIRSAPYDKDTLNTISDEFSYAIDSIVTAEDEEQMQSSIGANWKDMLEALNDPEKRKQMLLYQMSDTFAGQYGWKLSPLNVINVLAQKPDATFVTSARNWKQSFNRTVNTGARRIMISKPDNNKWQTKEELDAAAQRLGFKNYHDAMVRSNSSRQTAMGIQFTDKYDDNNKAYVNHVVYDVTDTTPINPQHDIWSEQMGLVNNLTGEANDALRKYIEDNNIDAQKQRKEVWGVQEDYVEEFKNRVLNLCDHSGVHEIMDNGTNPSAVLFNAIYQYALAMCEKQNILKFENQRHIALGAVAAIACMTNIPTSLASTYFNSKQVVTDSDAFQIFSICNDIMKLVPNQVKQEEKPLNENISNNFEEFKQFLTSKGVTIVEDPQEGLNEEFNSFWKRLNQKH